MGYIDLHVDVDVDVENGIELRPGGVAGKHKQTHHPSESSLRFNPTPPTNPPGRAAFRDISMCLVD
eukprot:scaffold437_cov168-Ochromonas_danica.AAC.60